MYPSLFGFKKLTDQHEIVNTMNNNNMNVVTQSQNQNSNQNAYYNDYDSVSITNNIEEFKSLFKTQEKACYELRSEVTVLNMKLEVASKMIKSQSKKIQSLKMKKSKLEIENNVYKNVLCNSSLSVNSNRCNKKYITNQEEQEEQEEKHKQHQNAAYPPPPPPPLPLPPQSIITQNKLKLSGNSFMNNVLDELKSKIKQID